MQLLRKCSRLDFNGQGGYDTYALAPRVPSAQLRAPPDPLCSTAGSNESTKAVAVASTDPILDAVYQQVAVSTETCGETAAWKRSDADGT